MSTCVIVESPYAANHTHTVEDHMLYVRRAMQDCIARNESPFASHVMYTDVLDDRDERHRELGIGMGFDWWTCAERVCFYTDMGWSRGMIRALNLALSINKEFTIRSLNGKPQMPTVVADQMTIQKITSRVEGNNNERQTSTPKA